MRPLSIRDPPPPGRGVRGVLPSALEQNEYYESAEKYGRKVEMFCQP